MIIMITILNSYHHSHPQQLSIPPPNISSTHQAPTKGPGQLIGNIDWKISIIELELWKVTSRRTGKSRRPSGGHYWNGKVKRKDIVTGRSIDDGLITSGKLQAPHTKEQMKPRSKEKTSTSNYWHGDNQGKTNQPHHLSVFIAAPALRRLRGRCFRVLLVERALHPGAEELTTKSATVSSCMLAIMLIIC